MPYHVLFSVLSLSDLNQTQVIYFNEGFAIVSASPFEGRHASYSKANFFGIFGLVESSGWILDRLERERASKTDESAHMDLKLDEISAFPS